MKKIFLSILFIAVSSYIFAQIPASFDLRDYEGENYVTTVKYQQEGTCWTHGTMAAIESNLYMTGAWEDAGESGEPALAEYHLDWWNGFNKHNNDDTDPPDGGGLVVHQGGDYRVSTAYLSRLEGAVREQDGQSFDTPPDRTNDNYHYYYPRHVEWYTAGEDLENLEVIKTKIMDYGVMATCIAWNGSFVDDSYNFYQPPSSDLLPNHSVAIIGWDDNHYVPAAGENGAWLVKNSWDSSWGLSGYFWISYYDKWSCQEPQMGAVSFIDVEPLQYTSVYYHDYHGWRDDFTDFLTAFNAFTATEDTWLKAVNIFTTTDTVEYEIKIYDTFGDNGLTDVLSVATGTANHTGFHTIDLELPVSLENDDEFYIYLEVSKGAIAYDRTSDVPVLLGGESKTIVESAAEEGQSYYFSSCCGWTDFYFYDDPSGFENTGNFCIKGLAEETTPTEFGAVFTVFDGEHGYGIVNAQIEFNGETKTTNNMGEALFANIPPEDGMEYTITANGYETQTETINIVDDVVFIHADMSSGNNILTLDNIGVSVYPNPTTGIFTIKSLQGFENLTRIKITDITGRTIQNFSTSEFQNLSTIDISNFAKGVYILKIETDGKIYSHRLILE